MAVSELIRLGEYELIRLLATGGMGEVFVARPLQPGAPRRVAIKRILRHLAADAAFVRMFLNEARIAAILSHPNVVRIFELGSENGACFMAMELVHGRSLRAIQQKAAQRGERVPSAIVAGVCAQALAGLHYAHQVRDEKAGITGVIHRDVSPDNVLVAFDGGVKVSDFGIAKALKDDEGTRTGLLKGKIGYMSPEHLEGHAVDGRADVYAMGIVLYELLTGSRPYAAATDALLIHRVLSGDRPRPLRELQPDVPADLEATALRALQRQPADRFTSARAMAEALGQPATAAEIASYLSALYGEETHVETDLGPAPPGTVALAQAAESPTQLASMPAPIPPSPRGRWRRPVAIAVGTALAAVTWWGYRAGARVTKPSTEPPPIAQLAPPAPPLPQTEPVHDEPVAEAPTPERVAPKDHGRRPTKPGKVAFRVYPWAEVFYRGKSLGVTPIAPVETPPGLQTFVLKNSQLSQEKEIHVQVSSGAVSVYKVDFLSR